MSQFMNDQMEMDSNSVFHLRHDEEDVAWLSINCRDARMNTLHSDHFAEMNQILDHLQNDPQVKGLVIYSSKQDCFIAGADIHMLDACETPADAEALAIQGQTLFARIEQMPFHVVAAIQGICLGGGLELALACHSRVGCLNESTRLGLPEVKLGILPGSGGTQRLPRLIGLRSALNLMLTGKQIRSKKAYQLGLLDDLAPESILMSVAKSRALSPKPKRELNWREILLSGNPIGRGLVLHLAKKQAFKLTRGNYPAPEAILNLIGQTLSQNHLDGYAQEAKEFARLVFTTESIALRRVFFASTALKKEKWVDAEPQDVTDIAVLGGGLMGAGIAYVSAIQAKCSVRIKEKDQQGLQHALQYIYQILHTKYQGRQISQPQLQSMMRKVSTTTDFSGMTSRNLVIEAVYEDLALKHQMIKDVEQHFPEHTIFATNTSALPIAQIASVAQHPELVIGLHYFSPVEKMPLVEIIPHAQTSAKTVATVVALAKQQGKLPILVQDSVGFYVNRMLAPYVNEAALVLLGGESIETIDQALLDFGFPVGPLQLLDDVGIDIGVKISPTLYEAYGERMKAPEIFERLLQANRLGRKSKQGFYTYQGKKKCVEQSIYELLSIQISAQYTPPQIAQRCTLMMLNEAARCLDEGVIASPRDGDMGAIFGIGFPPFLGGPFRYMDLIGIARVVTLLEQHERQYGTRFAPCDALLKMAEQNTTYYGD